MYKRLCMKTIALSILLFLLIPLPSKANEYGSETNRLVLCSNDVVIDHTIAYDWYEAYRDFILGGKYLINGQEYGADEGEICDPLVYLHDFDEDNIPELVISNGHTARVTRLAYIYSYEKGAVKYLSVGPADIFFIPDSKYSGVWGCYNDSGDFYWTYYAKRDSQIYDELVYGEISNSENYYLDENNATIIQKTENNDLFRESQKEKSLLYGAYISAIQNDGWDNFVANAGIAYSGDSAAIEINSKWSSLLKPSSFEYNNDLAMAAAQLSAAAEDKDGSQIRELYLAEGYQDIYLDNYGESFAYSIATIPIQQGNDITYLLTITARGTTTWDEILYDFTSLPLKNFMGYMAYEVVYDYEEAIWDGLDAYVQEHDYLYNENLKVLVTGHSLGGAAANLVAARFTRYADGGAWWSDILEKEDIYAYTFGAIDSIRSVFPVQNGFENIHNIYNFYDSFGPMEFGRFLPNGIGSIYGKFGHIDMFAHEYRIFNPFDFSNYAENITFNHNMPQYIDAVQNEYVKCKGKGIRVIISCPVNVAVVYNDDVVGLIQDNQIVMESPAVPMAVIGESKYVFFYDTAGYSIQLTATDDGEMDYSVENLSEGNAVKFTNVALKKGKQILSEVKDSPQNVEMYVINSDGEVIKRIFTDGTEKAVGGDYIIFWIMAVCLVVGIIIGGIFRRQRMRKKNVLYGRK